MVMLILGMPCSIGGRKWSWYLNTTSSAHPELDHPSHLPPYTPPAGVCLSVTLPLSSRPSSLAPLSRSQHPSQRGSWWVWPACLLRTHRLLVGAGCRARDHSDVLEAYTSLQLVLVLSIACGMPKTALAVPYYGKFDTCFPVWCCVTTGV
jgi:hypothetical protein